MTLSRQADLLRSWVSEAALPYWAKNGIDAQGGFYEDLDLNGQPRKEVVRRFRVQARQVYVYAYAAKLGWFDGKDIASRGYDFLLKQGFERGDRPGFIHLLNSDYSVNDHKRDLYDHAFYLLSSLWSAKVPKHPKANDTINKILSFLETDLRTQNGGWDESIPRSLPRRQNPHMHLFEAGLNGLCLTGDQRWRKLTDQVFDLFESKFFDKHTSTISEFFDGDWSLSKGNLGQTAEPGHAAEWVWLLGWYERLTGIDTSSYAERLYSNLLQSENLFLNDEEDKQGHVRRGTKRLWCQTELIKAHLAQSERKVPGALDMASAAIDGFHAVYLKPDGTWVDQIDENGTPCASTIPASTFYHIFCMIAELDRVSRL